MKKQKTHDEAAETEVEVGNGNIYEQLGYKDYKEMGTKANLVMEINSAIKKKKLTQTAAAEILGISQPKLSDLLKGHFRGYSIERLMNFLNELGKDVDIVVKNKPRGRRGRVTVYHSNNGDRPIHRVAAKGR